MHISHELMQSSPNTNISNDGKRLASVAQEFEQIFAQMMIKSMRSSLPGNSLFEESMGEKIYTDMLDGEFARVMAEKQSLGLAKVLVKQMGRNLDETTVSEALKILSTRGTPKATVRDNRVDPNTLYALEKKREYLYNEKANVPTEKSNKPPVHKKDEAKITKAIQAYENSSSTKDPLIGFSPRIQSYRHIIGAMAQKYDVDQKLIAAVIQAESAGRYDAVSPVGAKGLMQLMDPTARELGVTDSFDPAQNIEGGTKYLRQMIDRFGDIPTALAAYNAGPGRVRQYGGIPPFRETQNYVNQIMRILNR